MDNEKTFKGIILDDLAVLLEKLSDLLLEAFSEHLSNLTEEDIKLKFPTPESRKKFIDSTIKGLKITLQCETIKKSSLEPGDKFLKITKIWDKYIHELYPELPSDVNFLDLLTQYYDEIINIPLNSKFFRATKCHTYLYTMYTLVMNVRKRRSWSETFSFLDSISYSEDPYDILQALIRRVPNGLSYLLKVFY